MAGEIHTQTEEVIALIQAFFKPKGKLRRTRPKIITQSIRSARASLTPHARAGKCISALPSAASAVATICGAFSPA